MLVGRIALRSTALGDHKSSGAGVYPFRDLENRLRALRVAEQSAEVQAGVATETDAEAAAAVRGEARAIASMINNVSASKMVDLFDAEGQIKRPAFFEHKIRDIFLDGNGAALFLDGAGQE